MDGFPFISGYVTPNVRKIHEQLMEKDVEGSYRGLILGTTLEDAGRKIKNDLGITGLRAGI